MGALKLLLVIFATLLVASQCAQKDVTKLQIGVKVSVCKPWLASVGCPRVSRFLSTSNAVLQYRPESCEVKAKAGDKVAVHYTVRHPNHDLLLFSCCSKFIPCSR
jgi:hypothetical protein